MTASCNGQARAGTGREHLEQRQVCVCVCV